VKIYHVCECCDKVYLEQEAEGEGCTQVNGLCPDCLEEIGHAPGPFATSNRWFYN